MPQPDDSLGVKIKEQFRGIVDGDAYDVFKINVDASTPHLAKMRARAWARSQYPTRDPREVKVLEAMKEGKAQTVISDFIPKTFSRNRYTVEIGIQ